MINQIVTSFLTELKEKNILGKGISVFSYENNKYEVFSKISDTNFHFFRIINDQIVIENKTSLINVTQELFDILKNETKINLTSILNQLSLDKLISYNEILVLEDKESPDYWTHDEFHDFETANNCFGNGHKADSREAAMSFYLKGLLLGINYRKGIDLAYDSIAQLLEKYGDYNMAIKMYEKCIELKLSPMELLYYYHIGHCYFYLEDYVESIYYYTYYLKLKTHPGIQLLRAEAYIANHEYENARADLTDIIQNARKDFGLSVADRLNNTEKWKVYQKYGEVPTIQNARKLISSILGYED